MPDKNQLSMEETREMFLHLCKGMITQKDLLTQADKEIGDGDHGMGMARGFTAVLRKIENQTFASVDVLVKTVGQTLMSSMGGASGIIFGTVFTAGARRLGGRDSFDSQALGLMLADGLEGVKNRGKAGVGSKTMVDALEPAALMSAESASKSLAESLVDVTAAAREGMEKTKQMVAAFGRAKTLGERSLGYADPGALSTYLILKFMAEFVKTLEN